MIGQRRGAYDFVPDPNGPFINDRRLADAGLPGVEAPALEENAPLVGRSCRDLGLGDPPVLPDDPGPLIRRNWRDLGLSYPGPLSSRVCGNVNAPASGQSEQEASQNQVCDNDTTLDNTTCPGE